MLLVNLLIIFQSQKIKMSEIEKIPKDNTEEAFFLEEVSLTEDSSGEEFRYESVAYEPE